MTVFPPGAHERIDPHKLWILLNDLARNLGVEVRLESLESGEEYETAGGLCRLGPRLVAFVERGLPPAARNRQLGRALAGLDREGVFLRPAVREFLDDLAREAPRE